MKTELKMKTDDERHYMQCQIAVLRLVAERVYQLKREVSGQRGCDPDAAWIELEFLRGFSADGFSMNKFALPESTGDAPPMQPGTGELYEVWQELWMDILDGYKSVA
ncbi:MAG: hypothetical protein WCR46_24535 [Deltaproteobacteria bacterium]